MINNKTKEKYITSYFYDNLDQAWIDYMELEHAILNSKEDLNNNRVYIHFLIVGSDEYEIRMINII